MKNRLFLILALLLTVGARAQSVRFETSLTFNELLKKAKQERKYILLDCYTTWCGPCKQMDNETFQDLKVGQVVNSRFIAAKFQMDKTKADIDAVKALYSDAEMLRKKFSIQSFPSLVFLSPEGELVLKVVGLRKSDQFLKDIALALDTIKNYQGRITAFKSRRLRFSEGKNLINDLVKAGERNMAKEITAYYFKNDLNTMSENDLLTIPNISFISTHLDLVKGNDRFFKLFKNNGAAIDSIVKRPGLAYSNMMQVVLRDEINVHIRENGHYKDVVPEWDKYYKTIVSKYDERLANSATSFAKLHWYKHKQDWHNAIKALFAQTRATGVPLVDLPMLDFNGDIYEIVLKYSNNRSELQQAADWMKVIVDKVPELYSFLDTYASLLYKLGQKDAAILLEERALKLARNAKDTDAEKFYADILEKMKGGKVIW